MLLFTIAGPDHASSTADDRQVAVRLDMTSADAPVAVTGEVLDALRGTDGAIAGFLVRDGNQIQRVDASLANPVDLFTVPPLALSSCSGPDPGTARQHGV